MLRIGIVASKRIYLLTFIVLLVFGQAYAQDVKLKVLDAVSLTPIEGVNIYCKDKFDKKGGARSAQNGIAILSNYSFPIRVTFSMIGYEKDTLVLTQESAQWKKYGYYYTLMMKPRSTQLKRTVITGRLRPVLGSSSIYKVQTITENEIAKRAAVNLTDVLQFEMNQFVSNDNILGASNNIGGIGAQNVKILLNGVPLNGSEAGFIDLNQININNVKRIETVQGPMSVMYGSNALGGVINIITKEAKKKTELGLRTYMDNLMRVNFAADMGWKRKRHNTKLSVGRNFFPGWAPSDTLRRWLLWKPKVQYNADFSYRYSLPKGKISLYSFYLNEEIENRGVPSISPFRAFAFDEYYHTNRFRNTLNIDYQLSSKEYFKSQNTFSIYDRKKNKYYKDLVSMNRRLTDDLDDHDTSIFHQYHFRGAVNSSRIKHTDILLGYELNHETSRSTKISSPSTTSGNALNPDIETTGGNRAMTEFGFFTSANYEYKNLSIMPSVRLNLHSVFKRNVSYGLHIKYSPSSTLHYRASFAQGYRTPNIKEMYLEFIDNNHRILGNEELRQEEGIHAEISGEKKWTLTKKSDLFIEATAMYNQLQNKISLSTVNSAQNEMQYFNIENFENFVSFVRLKYSNTSLQSSLGYSRTLLLQSTGLPASSFSELLASASYLIPKIDTRFNAFYRFTENQPIYFADGSYAMSKALHISNISLTKSFAKRIRVQMGVKNVFNIQNNVLNEGSNGVSTSPHGGENNTTLLLPRSIFFEILIKL